MRNVSVLAMTVLALATVLGCPPPAAPTSSSSAGSAMARVPTTSLYVPADAALVFQAKRPSVLLEGPIGAWMWQKEGVVASFLSAPVRAMLVGVPPAALTAGLGIDDSAAVTWSVRPTGDVLVDFGIRSPAAFWAGLSALALKTGTKLTESAAEKGAPRLITLQKPGETLLVAHQSLDRVALWLRPADAFAARATLLADRRGPVFREIQRLPDVADQPVDVFVRYWPRNAQTIPLVAELERALGPIEEITLTGASAAHGLSLVLAINTKKPLAADRGVPPLCAARVNKDAILWFSAPATIVSGSRFKGYVGVVTALGEGGSLRYVVDATPTDEAAGRSLLESVRSGAAESDDGSARIEASGAEVEVFQGDESVMKAHADEMAFTLSRDGDALLVPGAQCADSPEVPFFVDVPRLFDWAKSADAEPAFARGAFRAFSSVLRGVGPFSGAYRISGGSLQFRFSSPEATGRALWFSADQGPGRP